MPQAPIPPLTIPNLCSAIGDVMRTSAAWGYADAKGDQSPQVYAMVAQYVMQLLTLSLQREPTEAEVAMIFGQTT